MRFVDEARIRVHGGRGGNGCVSFRREKYVPRGGPDGGDGGKGGDILLEATERKHTLLDFRYRHLFRAPSGKHGQGKNRHGRSGEDLVIEVPVGTVIKDPGSGEVFADLAESGRRFIVAKGGSGGRGNARFVSSTHQVPRIAEEGQDGEERELILELKLIADVGLVGLPNAGKSTLISAVSAARPKIADYPFTTLVPNLGVVQFEDASPFVIADIPGLIEGAHEGAGLGTRFLKHIERTRILVHLIDSAQVPEEDPLIPFRQVEHELASFSEDLPKKGRVIVLSKIDLVADSRRIEEIAEVHRGLGFSVVPVSAVTGEGLHELLRLLTRLLADTAMDEPFV